MNPPHDRDNVDEQQIGLQMLLGGGGGGGGGGDSAYLDTSSSSSHQKQHICHTDHSEKYNFKSHGAYYNALADAIKGFQKYFIRAEQRGDGSFGLTVL